MAVQGITKNAAEMRSALLLDARLLTLHVETELCYKGNGEGPYSKLSSPIIATSRLEAR